MRRVVCSHNSPFHETMASPNCAARLFPPGPQGEKPDIQAGKDSHPKMEPMAGIEPATDGLRIRYWHFTTTAQTCTTPALPRL